MDSDYSLHVGSNGDDSHAYDDWYKKLLSSVDFTRNFFFSCTYPNLQSLQRNMLVDEAKRMPYENMFVWISLLTTQQQMDDCSRAWIV